MDKLDKKRLTETVRTELVRRKLVVDEDRVHLLQTNDYNNKFIRIKEMVSPSELIIQLDSGSEVSGGGDDDSDRVKEQLERRLATWWTAHQGFDMISEFPGKRVHVIVAVPEEQEYDEAPERVDENGVHFQGPCTARGSHGGNNEDDARSTHEDCLVCSENASSLHQFEKNRGASRTDFDHVTETLQVNFDRQRVRAVGKGTRFYRGVITDLVPGTEVFDAQYQVFLYDQGIFRQCKISSIAALPQSFRNPDPTYRLLRIPGLKPLMVIEKTTDLVMGAKSQLFRPCGSWTGSAMESAMNVLRSSDSLRLETFGDHGVEIFADLRFSSGNLKEQSYVEYLQDEKLALRDDKSFYNELGQDGEDEELGDWMTYARS